MEERRCGVAVRAPERCADRRAVSGWPAPGLDQPYPQRMIVAEGSVKELEALIKAPIDGLVCNILAEVIIDLIPQWTAIVKLSTWGILSGILLEQAKPVADTLEENDWIVAALWKRGDWCCLNIRRS